MSTISGISPSPYTPIASQVKPTAVNPQTTTPAVQPVAADSDGDNDGSKGSTINTHAYKAEWSTL